MPLEKHQELSDLDTCLGQRRSVLQNSSLVGASVQEIHLKKIDGVEDRPQRAQKYNTYE
jgi:hypothetical protein